MKDVDHSDLGFHHGKTHTDALSGTRAKRKVSVWLDLFLALGGESVYKKTRMRCKTNLFLFLF
jgi:hypothetical protein